jgi:hypothetical protein
LGGGEPLFGWPPWIDYPGWLAALLPGGIPGGPAAWIDAESGALLFPYKTLAAAVGLLLLPIVSRLTATWDPPRPLRSLPTDRADAAHPS